MSSTKRFAHCSFFFFSCPCFFFFFFLINLLKWKERRTLGVQLGVLLLSCYRHRGSFFAAGFCLVVKYFSENSGTKIRLCINAAVHQHAAQNPESCEAKHLCMCHHEDSATAVARRRFCALIYKRLFFYFQGCNYPLTISTNFRNIFGVF